MGSIIEFDNVSYRYPRCDEFVLKDINLDIQEGEFLAIIGENGAGKTTFSKCINGIIPQSERGKLVGEVRVDGVSTKKASVSQISQKVGIVLEDPETQLFTTKVVNEIAFGPENLNKPVKKILETIDWVLDVVRLNGYEERSPSALSGGQKQRLAIAAALSMRPDIIVLDEPTSQLDPLGTDEVFEVIEELKCKYNMTIIMVTHKTDKIIQFADRVGVLKDGKVIKCATPDIIFKEKDLLEKINVKMPSIYALINYLEDAGVEVCDFSTKEDGIEAIKDCLREGVS